ncbi:MAG: helix-turn-helix transcriptional regulator [Sneathiella sp.]|nr:helix-turn-helix transcriptional regulator [Sneathiella sp.]
MEEKKALRKYHMAVEMADGQKDKLLVEDSHQVDPKLAKTRIERTKLRNGGSIDYQEIVLDQEMRMDVASASKILQICVMLPIEGRYTMITPDGKECHFSSNQGFMFRDIGKDYTFILPENQIVRSMGFCFTPEVFARYLDNRIPETMKPMFQPIEDGTLPMAFPLSKFMRETLDRNIQIEAQGSLQQIQWEATALLCMALVEESMRKSTSETEFSPSKEDKKKAEEALGLLMCDLRDPPCLSDLAKKLAFTEKRLNLVFKSLYGDTVFECLRSMRLEKAKSLIETTDMAIKEIAWAVGYNHSTNFSKAFTGKFDVTPASYAKKVRTL